MRGLIGMIAAALLMLPMAAWACEGPVAVCDGAPKGDAFMLIRNGQPATVYVESKAARPVLRVAEDFADDLERVSGVRPKVVHSLDGVTGDVVFIADIGHTDAKPADASAIAGKWEAYQQSIGQLADGRYMLVIMGADPRGAVYGTYDISEKMGVSPWYWWADVPVARKANVYITKGERQDAPTVKYRGFFLNDEEPSLGGWAREKFGGLNHQFYAKVFELDLRLKGNYLWPAMWGKSIADDDPESLNTADEYGIVLGTSHHEPMTRAQEEWHRHLDTISKDGGITGGRWDYTKNAENLRAFWRGGIERMVQGHHENVVTVGMRGDGDEPMSEGTATQLLETIVADQRQIIADVTGKPASETPQVWALYKEVQDYYDHGMTVPDDVTLLFSDDNWGQIRRLPDPKAPPRTGGYGVYYHFDYVGGPRNYKWINTNQIEKVWQQMELAHESGADRLWIVNVGDLKPMEFPLSFFLDMAWNPDAMTPDALKAYPVRWAGQQFGPDHAQEIGDILTRYSQYNARRKPELLNETLFDNDVMYSVQQAFSWDSLADLELAERGQMSPGYAASWFQLVQYPVEASRNLFKMYASTSLNHRCASENDAKCANQAADEVETDFARDTSLSAQYNSLLDGKWAHMMDQIHIGYTGWQQPDKPVTPVVTRLATSSTNEEKPDFQFGFPDPDSKHKAFAGGRFQETYGYVAIEAEHYARKVEGKGVRWQTVPNLGRTLSSVISLPQTAPVSDPAKDGMRLEYDVTLAKEVDATLNLYLAPTLDTQGKGGLRVAVSIDNEPPQTLSFDLRPDQPAWNKAVIDNIIVLQAPFKGLKAGQHTIKVFRIDGNVVLERLVLDTGALQPSYLGPPESPTVH